MISSVLLYLGRPFHSSKHANLTLCLSHLHSDQKYFVTVMLLMALFNFPDNRPSLKTSHWSACLSPGLPENSQASSVWVNKVVRCFDFLHYVTDLVTFPLWNPAHMVISALRNMAYFLLQMSSQGIYLLNCKRRKIIHISVIRHARNTSQNPICLVIKKRKSFGLILCRFKIPPWGFLFINYFAIFLP